MHCGVSVVRIANQPPHENHEVVPCCKHVKRPWHSALLVLPMQQAAQGNLEGRLLSPTLDLHDARPQGRMRAGSGEMTSEGIPPPPLPCSCPGRPARIFNSRHPVIASRAENMKMYTVHKRSHPLAGFAFSSTTATSPTIQTCPLTLTRPATTPHNFLNNLHHVDPRQHLLPQVHDRLCLGHRSARRRFAYRQCWRPGKPPRQLPSLFSPCPRYPRSSYSS